VFGKTFHLTPGGKIYPLGAKQNWFTKCMSEKLTRGALKLQKGEGEVIVSKNKEKFGKAKDKCLVEHEALLKAS
jgi:hypothetical protein